MNYSELNVTSSDVTVTINFNGKDINVKQYIPMLTKYYLAQGIVDTCTENKGKTINLMKKDIIYVLSIIKEYTDLEVDSPDNLEDTTVLYDDILTSGLYETIINAIPEKEINSLNTYIENAIEEVRKYQSTPTAMINEVVDIIQSLVEKIDPQTLTSLYELSSVLDTNKMDTEELKTEEEKIEEKDNK